MLIISDTNILSSFAAGDALSLLTELFSDYTLHIPVMSLNKCDEQGNVWPFLKFYSLSALAK